MISNIRYNALIGSSLLACMIAAPAYAQPWNFNIPEQPAASAITALGDQADVQIIAARRITAGKQANAIRGSMKVDQALLQLLQGTDLTARQTGPQTYTIVPRTRTSAAAARATTLVIAPAMAHAQPADTANAGTADTASTADSERDIVVTGTRIVQDGYSAPVPVSVLGAADILAQRPNNITDLVNTLPAVTSGTSTSANSSANISSGASGVNTINLRGLGSERTLVLIDGRRTPPTTFNDLVDVNTIPQDLVQRVEVVTGGASAQYGSDAVGGVVNFILDDKFKGLKLGADTGITTYGDGHTYRFSGTAGLSFLDDRLHILLNGEYFHQDGIDQVDRPWNDRGYALHLNPAYTATNGQPQYLVGSGIGVTRTTGGLINSGPLRGTYFLGDGVTGQFNYGTTNSVSDPWMIGGDWQLSVDGVAGTASLQPTEERIGVFNQIGFELTPDITLYGQFSWNRYEGQNFNGSVPRDETIKADNAYLLTQYPQVAAAMQANGLSSIPVRNWNQGVPFKGTDNSRQVFRYLAGAKGELSLLDRPWSWDVFYQKGVTKTHEQTTSVWNNARLALATDPVLSNGQIVCRSTLTNPTNGCVPLDVLGTGGQSTAALDYIFGPEQPWRRQTIEQDVVSASLTGELFDLPGGAAAIALGGEWRKDQVHSRVGATSSSGWSVANYKPNFGEITVKEAFLEVALPLFTGFDLSAAGRYTDYSTSGSVQTWKVGATYSPIRDIKFRGAYSRDIRAPNMAELFQSPQTIGAAGTVLPANSPAPGPVNDAQEVTSGNPNLKPERANTLTAGVVVTPSFLPGFSASFDFYDIKLKDVIGSVSRTQLIDFCYGGFDQFCSNLVFTGNHLDFILTRPINFASRHARGFDIEASYATPLSAISANLPGNFRIHATATHYIKNVVDNLILPVDYAGVIADGVWGPAGASPSWAYRVSAFYDLDPVTINLVARGFSDGVYSNNYIECTSSCPTSTFQHRTISNNRIKGSLYFDGSVGMKIRSGSDDTRLSFIVNNILNKDPTPVGVSETSITLINPQTARPLFDTLGRVFRVALTTKF